MKILVLGGTGAMGVDLVKNLARRGENVTVTSRIKRKSELENVRYIQGNAHDSAFLQTLLNDNFDVIVDFMVYSTEEFRVRRDMLLAQTGQYIYLSSGRVYADLKAPITEDSPRLLDVIDDKEYLKTDEYALAKARQENLLHESGRRNWTIIRPYITYSNQRLQLGVYEKELWCYRALHDKTIVFPRAIAERCTTMTLGEDVARGISKLIGNEKAMGEAFHITTNRTIKWDDVLAIYKRVFYDMNGYKIRVEYIDDPKPIYEAMGNKYQVIYDRLFERRFENSKFLQTAGKCEFESVEIGLEKCLRDFLRDPKFRNREPKAQAWMDKETGEHIPLSQFNEPKDKVKYVIGRYTPYFNLIRKRK